MLDQTIRMLLVEDNPTDVLLLEEVLAQVSSVQFEWRHRERLAEALDSLSQETFEVCLLDLSLPDSHGLETLVKVREQAPGLPIVVLTGLDDEAFGLSTLQAGAQDYLIKGQVESDGLARAIRYAIERQRAEEALATERQRLRTLIDNLPDVIYLKDTQGHFIIGNRAVAHMMGVGTPEEIIGKTDFDFYPAELAEHHHANEQAVVRSGQAVLEREESLFNRGGSAGWFLTTHVPLRDGQGQVVGLVGISRDITERKRREEEIQRRNRELGLLNQVIAASALGQEPEAMLDIVCRELARAFDLPRVNAALLNSGKNEFAVVAEALTGAGPAALNQRFPVKDNAVLSFLLNQQGPLVIGDIRQDPRLAPLYELASHYQVASVLIAPLIVEGEVVGCLNLNDVQPRHFSAQEMNLVWSVAEQVVGALTRARLGQIQQRLSAAIEQAAESVIITDTEGIIIYVNPAFEQISGYSQAEALGQTPSFMKSGQHDAIFYQELWAAISAGRVWRGRFVNQRKDGTLYTEDATITPVHNENQVIVNYVSVQRDVTRELQLEEQYLQAQKMEAIGRLSGGVAHDFNNLLVVITGYSELLLDRHLSADSPLRKFVEEIQRAGERAAGLTQQLLAFSRKQVLQPQILNLNDTIVTMDKMLWRLIGEDIDLITKPSPNLGQVKADPGQVEQIILNLVVNARDAMPHGGKIIIETANVELDEAYTRHHSEVKPGLYTLLAVSDTGTGMDAATQSLIFEPFFTTKEQGKGTGLGLSTVFGIVKQSGGNIWVYSELGRGTTFKIYLPQVQERIASQEPRPNLAELSPGHETILLVEDEAPVRGLARQVLELGGYTVLEATRGSEALLHCEQQQGAIDLLLTDVIMPGGLNGRELAEQVRAVSPGVKVLYMSGYTDDAIVHHGVLEPGLFFLQKPFTPVALARKVREVLEAGSRAP